MREEPKRYLRVPEASREFNIRESLLRKMILKRTIESIRFPGTRIVLIDRKVLEKMMVRGSRSTASRHALHVQHV